jgi:hypothetical protein
MVELATPPEYNITGQDYAERSHFRYTGPIVDIHAHVFQTRAADPPSGAPLGVGPGASVKQAETMLAAGREFGIVRTYSMCPPDDISVLRERFGAELGFNGSINKTLDEPEEVAYKLLDRFLNANVEMLKFWSAPRGRDRGLYVNAPWRMEVARRARAAGITVIMVHVGDPDVWFRTTYADVAKFGTKPDHYRDFVQMLEAFPDIIWIGAHMGGDPEHPDHLESLLENYPHLYFDTSATKWQVREVSTRRDAIRNLVCRYPRRFLFGTDLVTRHHAVRDHYVSRYWCQRTLWESEWEGASPIADPDFTAFEGGATTPTLRGLALPADVMEQVYYRNALRLLPRGVAAAVSR